MLVSFDIMLIKRDPKTFRNGEACQAMLHFWVKPDINDIKRDLFG